MAKQAREPPALETHKPGGRSPGEPAGLVRASSREGGGAVHPQLFRSFPSTTSIKQICWNFLFMPLRIVI